jgi:hypothetical protein
MDGGALDTSMYTPHMYQYVHRLHKVGQAACRGSRWLTSKLARRRYALHRVCRQRVVPVTVCASILWPPSGAQHRGIYIQACAPHSSSHIGVSAAVCSTGVLQGRAAHCTMPCARLYRQSETPAIANSLCRRCERELKGGTRCTDSDECLQRLCIVWEPINPRTCLT